MDTSCKFSPPISGNLQFLLASNYAYAPPLIASLSKIPEFYCGDLLNSFEFGGGCIDVATRPMTMMKMAGWYSHRRTDCPAIAGNRLLSVRPYFL